MPKKKNPSKWTLEQKMEAVFHAKSLSEEKLGEYLPSVGLHSSTREERKSGRAEERKSGRAEERKSGRAEERKSEIFSALSSSNKKPGRPAKDPELRESQKKIKELKRDLDRKDKALAEQTAIIILQKNKNTCGTRRTNKSIYTSKSSRRYLGSKEKRV